MKGRAFLLNAVADDQAHLIYIREYGLHTDRRITRDQSIQCAFFSQRTLVFDQIAGKIMRF